MMRPVTLAKKTGVVICLCLFLYLITGTPGFGQEAILSGTVVANTRDDILFFTTIKNAFNEKVETAVKSGVPATFSFFIELNGSRKMWFDKTIADRKETHALTYDPLKEEYRVTRSWEGDKPFISGSFKEACARMSRIEGLALARMDTLHKGSLYQVKAKAQLDKMTLPLYLHYVLIFVSFWDVETDWQTVYFTY